MSITRLPGAAQQRICFMNNEAGFWYWLRTSCFAGPFFCFVDVLNFWVSCMYPSTVRVEYLSTAAAMNMLTIQYRDFALAVSSQYHITPLLVIFIDVESWFQVLRPSKDVEFLVATHVLSSVPCAHLLDPSAHFILPPITFLDGSKRAEQLRVVDVQHKGLRRRRAGLNFLQ